MNRKIVLEDEIFLQPPQGKRYVRSFLFSRRIDAPFAAVHLIPRTLLVLCLSGLQLRTIDAAHPDIAGAALLWCVSILVFLASGMYARVARLYFLLTLPSLFSLFTTWLLFNPVAGKVTLLTLPLYSGRLPVGITLWGIVWVGIVVAYFLWTRKLLTGILVGAVLAFVIAHLPWRLEWIVAQIPLFHPLTVTISDRGLLVAVTKVIGYSGMVLITIALVVSSRDVELIGALRQLRIPQPVVFFVSTVFRSLDLALSDYDTIRQAQLARAINARPRSFLKRLRDLGSIAVPMVAMMIRRSGEIGDALLARGYRLSKESTDFYETRPLRLLDWAVLVVSLALLYPTFGPRFDVTGLLQQWFTLANDGHVLPVQLLQWGIACLTL
ncbi:MAG: energy-coupling factor transporter transmembrane protein EcfT [Ktedonobacteraceae bacterium]|nr:energy-coupling factor transporter transmembrane protein EcfT [Ktedonobacteraceae bacterium]